MSKSRIHWTILVLASLMAGADRLGYHEAGTAFAITLGLFILSTVYDEFKELPKPQVY